MDTQKEDTTPQAPAQGESQAELAEAIAHQVRYARGERGMARWDRSMGIWPKSVPLSRAPGFYRAALAMKLARAYKLEAKTGLRHCHCHFRPDTTCPAKPDSVPYWKRGHFGTGAASRVEG